MDCLILERWWTSDELTFRTNARRSCCSSGGVALITIGILVFPLIATSRWPWPTVVAFLGIYLVIGGLAFTVARPVLDGVVPPADDEPTLEPPWATGLVLYLAIGFVLPFIVLAGIDEPQGMTGLGITVGVGGLLVLGWIMAWRSSWITLARRVLRKATALGTLDSDPFSHHMAYARVRYARATVMTGRPRTKIPAVARVTVANEVRSFEPAEAIWFAPVRWGTSSPPDSHADIAQGDSVLIIAREHHSQFLGTRADPVIVFGASGDARAVLRRIVRGWFALCAATAAVAAAAIGLALTL
ncbi:MAG: hypothetical protein H0T89_26340 [Deltaproteobacteria bacterium]|nr:hypothetical protein [Deltaproteobacteria bacterium]